MSRSRIDKLFEKQAKVTQMRDFWFFVEGDLMKGLYWEKLYNKGRKTTEFRWLLYSLHVPDHLQVPLHGAQGTLPGPDPGAVPVPSRPHRQEHDV